MQRKRDQMCDPLDQLVVRLDARDHENSELRRENENLGRKLQRPGAQKQGDKSLDSPPKAQIPAAKLWQLHAAGTFLPRSLSTMVLH